jgi:predicted nucleic acid-binding Zn ribbon protein
MAFKRDWYCPGCDFKVIDISTAVKKKTCPMCDEPMVKVLSPPVVIFKGSGWTPRHHRKTKED